MQSFFTKRRIIFLVIVLLIFAAIALVPRLGFITSNRASSAVGELYIPAPEEAYVGTTITIPLFLNTGGAPINGVDAIVEFDKTALELTDIANSARATTSLKTYLPLDASNNFNFAQVISRGNTEGVIEFGVVSYDMTSQTILTPYTGTTMLTLMKFRTKKVGSTELKIRYVPNSTTDSNIVTSDQTGLDILGKVTNATLIVKSAPVTVTPSPAATGVPTFNGSASVTVAPARQSIGQTVTMSYSATSNVSGSYKLQLQAKKQGATSPTITHTTSTLTFTAGQPVTGNYSWITVSSLTPGMYDVSLKVLSATSSGEPGGFIQVLYTAPTVATVELVTGTLPTPTPGRSTLTPAPSATAIPSPTRTVTPVPPTATRTPTITPVPPTATRTPTMTPVPPTATATPVPPTIIACATRSSGDANCDGKVNLIDNEIWTRAFVNGVFNPNADFNGDGKNSLLDNEIWTVSYLK